MVAFAHFSLPGRTGHRRRMGCRRVAVVETWPRKWRPWIAAMLQTAVNVGILIAGLVDFLMAAAPLSRCLSGGRAARRCWSSGFAARCRSRQEWRAAEATAHGHEPRVRDLFRGEVRRTTFWVVLVCGFPLTAHWAFMFWHQQHLRNLPDVLNWSDARRTNWPARRCIWSSHLPSRAISLRDGFPGV